jgi:Bacterial pre-peptidase C-terminal domain
MRTITLIVAAIIVLASLPLPDSLAQKKKKGTKNDEPRVIMAIPLGARPGATTKITMRGLKLDKATAIRFPGSKTTARIISKGNANVPDKNPDKVGDTQVVAEVTLPASLPAEPLSFVVVTPAGETKPHTLLVETALPVIAEKEPNDGFRQAQPIQIPQVVDGLIDRPHDVDVFRFEGKAGQRVEFEVLAARHGSALDSILTLYNAEGQELASNDDVGDSVDSRLEVTLPRDGVFFLSLIDAHDQGGPAHVYRLVARKA